MNQLIAEIVLNHQCVLGEGVIWNDKQKIIAWVDIEKGEIHEFTLKNKFHRIVRIGSNIGCIGICSNGDYIAATQKGIGIVNRDTEKLKIIANPESDKPNNRFNDGKCDPKGRFWAGTMSLLEERYAGNVYVLNQSFLIKNSIKNVTCSNGMAWDTRRQRFYYIDSPTFTVAVFDYDPFTGKITNERTAVRVPKEEGTPDGMTIDNQGMLWIAHWDGWQVARWNPFSGEKLAHVELPVSRVTSCTFGGERLDDLYITTANTGLSDKELEQQPLAGSLFVVHNSGYIGHLPYEFDTK